MHRPFWRLVVATALVAWCVSPAQGRESDFTQLSLQDLMNIDVTSVSKRPEKRAEAAAALYVITQDDIHRAGVTSIPEALRLAPGVEVARVSSNKWSIGVRGFGSTLARSVLVMIDGRSVYNPLFAGTYWELQNVLLENIDRIEVIRGPGGTLWGANAVNGVINIITKPAKDTQGGMLTGGGGSEERAFGGARYGGKLGENLYYRAYGKYFDRDGGFVAGHDAFDHWFMGRGGFRIDWNASPHDTLNLQGDAYEGRAGQEVSIARLTPPYSQVLEGDSQLSGANLLGHWRRMVSETSDLALQMYYDHTFRGDPQFREERNTFDVDFQHGFEPLPRHRLLWGFDYRVTADRTGPRQGAADFFVPDSRTDNLVSGFVQDEMTLIEDLLRLTIGSKLEHNDYSGFEYQPSGRLLLTPASGQTLWASISRAVRTPSRLDHDAQLTVPPLNLNPMDPNQCLPLGGPCIFPRVVGDRRFVSEEVLAYEVGYRIQPTSRVFLDVATFYNRYENLFSLEQGTAFTEAPGRSVVPFVISNKLDGETYGVEVAVDAFVTDWWRLYSSYSFLQLQLQHQRGGTDPTLLVQEQSSPHNQVSVRSTMDLPWQVDFDVVVRYVDNLPSQQTGSYQTFDVRLAKHVTPGLELAAVGQNLWAPHHREFAGGTDVQRGAYGQIKWQW